MLYEKLYNKNICQSSEKRKVNMNIPLISIIVPVYKVERYLPRCIESILRQTYTNFELILVDDGTPDRSGIICDRYAEKDSRIRVIHKENGGVSTARNAGIEAAQGELITFVDGDDWISDEYLEILSNPWQDNSYDMVVGSFEFRYFAVWRGDAEEGVVDISNINDEKTFATMCKIEFAGPCFKLFSADIIEKHRLRFPNNVAIAEDAIFVKHYLSLCKKIYVSSKVIYYYNRLNSSSVTIKNPYFKERKKWDDHYINVYVDTLSAWGVKEELLRKEISQKALDLFVTNARSVVNSFSRKEAITIIDDLMDYYIKWIDIDYKQATTEKNKILIDYLFRKDVDELYDFLKSKKQHSRVSIKLKNVIKKTIRPFIEKYRDGLVKFKF